jgi:hypothetical protein
MAYIPRTINYLPEAQGNVIIRVGPATVSRTILHRGYESVVACGALAWCFNLKHKKDPVTGEIFSGAGQ